MLALSLSAELNGVTDLSPLDTADEPFFYTFKVQCTSCREVHPNWVSISRHEVNEISGSRGEANFVWRCKSCKREASASIKDAPKPYALSTPPLPKNIIEIDCRGLEFLEFKADVVEVDPRHEAPANLPQGEWKAQGVDSATKFEGVDLTEGEWYDYDEKAGEEVSIKDIKWGIRRA